jgi:hypothetical protein
VQETKDSNLIQAEAIIAENAAKLRRKDRLLVRPRHFHGTIFCYVNKDDHGNFMDSQHNEVMGYTPDSCIRKAIARSQERQTLYHIAQLTECPDPTHTNGMPDEQG